MGRTFFISLCVCLLSVGLSLPIDQHTVCKDNARINHYILEALGHYREARESKNCSGLLDPKLNKNYCKCSSVIGMEGTKIDPPTDSTSSKPTDSTSSPTDSTSSPTDSTSSPTRSPSNSTSPPTDSTSSPTDSTSSPTDSTVNSTSTVSPPDSPDKVPGGGNGIKGCWLSFQINMIKGEIEVLGGDWSIYALPRGNLVKQNFTIKLLNHDKELIQEKDVSTSSEGDWKTLAINDFAVNLPYGSHDTKVNVMVTTDEDEDLTCDQIQQYFIIDCTAPKQQGAPTNELSTRYSMEPMTTLMIQKRKSVFSWFWNGRRRRGVTQNKCSLQKRFIKLSETLKDQVLVDADQEVDIGECVNLEATDVAAASQCGPRKYKYLEYIVRQSSIFEIQELPIIIQC